MYKRVYKSVSRKASNFSRCIKHFATSCSKTYGNRHMNNTDKGKNDSETEQNMTESNKKSKCTD